MKGQITVQDPCVNDNTALNQQTECTITWKYSDPIADKCVTPDTKVAFVWAKKDACHNVLEDVTYNEYNCHGLTDVHCAKGPHTWIPTQVRDAPYYFVCGVGR